MNLVTKILNSAALASAKTYADGIKNELLNGAGDAYDTLKELGDLIDNNADAIDALETIAAGKADQTHSHAISEVSGLQSALDGKAASSHGTHVSYSTTAPVITFFIFVLTKAAPFPGFTCWNSITCMTFPSISNVTPFLKSPAVTILYVLQIMILEFQILLYFTLFFLKFQ